VFLGIPLVLLPEEVVLLVENGIYPRVLDLFPLTLILVPEVAVIVNDAAAHLQPSLSELESWNDEQQTSFRQQVTANEAKAAKKDNSRTLSEEALQKRKEREEHKRLAAKKLEEDINIPSPPPETSQLEELDSMAKVPQSAKPEPSNHSANYTIIIPAASEYHWYFSDQETFTTIESAQKAGVWRYPSNLNERARSGVFRSLWTKGYFMGSGIKFGGDYLVYPGLFHLFLPW
jgi:tRNA-splicing endonuclease subunit Sen34